MQLVLLNYAKEEEFTEYRDQITWHSINLSPDPTKYYRSAKRLAIENRADWIVGFSDTYFGICAHEIGKRNGISTLIDAYDNYESYIDKAYPLHWLWRSALKHCTAITAAGPSLLKKLLNGRSSERAAVVEMAADPEFTCGSKHAARSALGLSQDAKIVSYCGSLYRNRGISELFEVMDLASKIDKEISWVLSGRIQKGISLPSNCSHLGYLDDNLVVQLLRSSDAMLCVNQPDNFGDFSYPVKVYEAHACSVPVFAFRTKSIGFVLRGYEERLFDFGDTQSMAKALCTLLRTDGSETTALSDWSREAEKLHRSLLEWGNT